MTIICLEMAVIRIVFRVELSFIQFQSVTLYCPALPLNRGREVAAPSCTYFLDLSAILNKGGLMNSAVSLFTMTYLGVK